MVPFRCVITCLVGASCSTAAGSLVGLAALASVDDWSSWIFNFHNPSKQTNKPGLRKLRILETCSTLQTTLQNVDNVKQGDDAANDLCGD